MKRRSTTISMKNLTHKSCPESHALNGAFHSHGGSPKKGWLISWYFMENPILEWMMTGGTLGVPMDWKSQIWHSWKSISIDPIRNQPRDAGLADASAPWVALGPPSARHHWNDKGQIPGMVLGYNDYNFHSQVLEMICWQHSLSVARMTRFPYWFYGCFVDWIRDLLSIIVATVPTRTIQCKSPTCWFPKKTQQLVVAQPVAPPHSHKAHKHIVTSPLQFFTCFCSLLSLSHHVCGFTCEITYFSWGLFMKSHTIDIDRLWTYLLFHEFPYGGFQKWGTPTVFYRGKSYQHELKRMI